MKNLKKATTPKWEKYLFRITLGVIMVLSLIVLYLYRDNLGALIQ